MYGFGHHENAIICYRETIKYMFALLLLLNAVLLDIVASCIDSTGINEPSPTPLPIDSSFDN